MASEERATGKKKDLSNGDSVQSSSDQRRSERKRKDRPPLFSPDDFDTKRKASSSSLVTSTSSSGTAAIAKKRRAVRSKLPATSAADRPFDTLPNGQPFTCDLCQSPYVCNPLMSKGGSRGKRSRHMPIPRQKVNPATGKLLTLCNACCQSLEGPGPSRRSAGVSPEAKEAYLVEAKAFAADLASRLLDPEAERFYCPGYNKTPCRCLQKYIGAEGKAEQSLERGKELLQLHKQSRKLAAEKVYNLDKVVNKRSSKKQAPYGSIGLGNGHKRSKRFETFVLQQRKRLKHDLHFCEKATQRILCYSNNFLHKKLKTEERGRRAERQKGKAALGLLDSLEALGERHCCVDRCVWMVYSHQNLVSHWRRRAMTSQREARRVLAEMLTPSGGVRCNCYKFIGWVTGCSHSTISKVRAQMRRTKGDREPPLHGLYSFWEQKTQAAKHEGDASATDTHDSESRYSGSQTRSHSDTSIVDSSSSPFISGTGGALALSAVLDGGVEGQGQGQAMLQLQDELLQQQWSISQQQQMIQQQMSSLGNMQQQWTCSHNASVMAGVQQQVLQQMTQLRTTQQQLAASIHSLQQQLAALQPPAATTHLPAAAAVAADTPLPCNTHISAALPNPPNVQIVTGLTNHTNAQTLAGLSNPPNTQMVAGLINPPNSQIMTGLPSNNSPIVAGLPNPPNSQIMTGLPSNSQIVAGHPNPPNPHISVTFAAPSNTTLPSGPFPSLPAPSTNPGPVQLPTVIPPANIHTTLFGGAAGPSLSGPSAAAVAVRFPNGPFFTQEFVNPPNREVPVESRAQPIPSHFLPPGGVQCPRATTAASRTPGHYPRCVQNPGAVAEAGCVPQGSTSPLPILLLPPPPPPAGNSLMPAARSEALAPLVLCSDGQSGAWRGGSLQFQAEGGVLDSRGCGQPSQTGVMTLTPQQTLLFSSSGQDSGQQPAQQPSYQVQQPQAAAASVAPQQTLLFSSSGQESGQQPSYQVQQSQAAAASVAPQQTLLFSSSGQESGQQPSYQVQQSQAATASVAPQQTLLFSSSGQESGQQPSYQVQQSQAATASVAPQQTLLFSSSGQESGQQPSYQVQQSQGATASVAPQQTLLFSSSGQESGQQPSYQVQQSQGATASVAPQQTLLFSSSGQESGQQPPPNFMLAPSSGPQPTIVSLESGQQPLTVQKSSYQVQQLQVQQHQVQQQSHSQQASQPCPHGVSWKPFSQPRWTQASGQPRWTEASCQPPPYVSSQVFQAEASHYQSVVQLEPPERRVQQQQQQQNMVTQQWTMQQQQQQQQTVSQHTQGSQPPPPPPPQSAPVLVSWIQPELLQQQQQQQHQPQQSLNLFQSAGPQAQSGSSSGVPSLQNALPGPALQNALPGPALQNALPGPALQNASPGPALQNALPGPALQNALPGPALQNALPGPALQNALQNALPGPALQNALQNALPGPALQNALPGPALQNASVPQQPHSGASPGTPSMQASLPGSALNQGCVPHQLQRGVGLQDTQSPHPPHTHSHPDHSEVSGQGYQQAPQQREQSMQRPQQLQSGAGLQDTQSLCPPPPHPDVSEVSGQGFQQYHQQGERSAQCPQQQEEGSSSQGPQERSDQQFFRPPPYRTQATVKHSLTGFKTSDHRSEAASPSKSTSVPAVELQYKALASPDRSSEAASPTECGSVSASTVSPAVLVSAERVDRPCVKSLSAPHMVPAGTKSQGPGGFQADTLPGVSLALHGSGDASQPASPAVRPLRIVDVRNTGQASSQLVHSRDDKGRGVSTAGKKSPGSQVPSVRNSTPCQVSLPVASRMVAVTDGSSSSTPSISSSSSSSSSSLLSSTRPVIITLPPNFMLAPSSGPQPTVVNTGGVGAPATLLLQPPVDLSQWLVCPQLAPLGDVSSEECPGKGRREGGSSLLSGKGHREEGSSLLSGKGVPVVPSVSEGGSSPGLGAGQRRSVVRQTSAEKGVCGKTTSGLSTPATGIVALPPPSAVLPLGHSEGGSSPGLSAGQRKSVVRQTSVEKATSGVRTPAAGIVALAPSATSPLPVYSVKTTAVSSCLRQTSVEEGVCAKTGVCSAAKTASGLSASAGMLAVPRSSVTPLPGSSVKTAVPASLVPQRVVSGILPQTCAVPFMDETMSWTVMGQVVTSVPLQLSSSSLSSQLSAVTSLPQAVTLSVQSQSSSLSSSSSQSSAVTSLPQVMTWTVLPQGVSSSVSSRSVSSAAVLPSSAHFVTLPQSVVSTVQPAVPTVTLPQTVTSPIHPAVPTVTLPQTIASTVQLAATSVTPPAVSVSQSAVSAPTVMFPQTVASTVAPHLASGSPETIPLSATAASCSTLSDPATSALKPGAGPVTPASRKKVKTSHSSPGKQRARGRKGRGGRVAAVCASAGDGDTHLGSDVGAKPSLIGQPPVVETSALPSCVAVLTSQPLNTQSSGLVPPLSTRILPNTLVLAGGQTILLPTPGSRIKSPHTLLSSPAESSDKTYALTESGGSASLMSSAARRVMSCGGPTPREVCARTEGCVVMEGASGGIQTSSSSLPPPPALRSAPTLLLSAVSSAQVNYLSNAPSVLVSASSSGQVNLNCAQVLRNAPTVSLSASSSGHATSGQVNFTSGHATSAQVNLNCAQVLRNAPTVSLSASSSGHATSGQVNFTSGQVKSGQVNLSSSQVLGNAPTMLGSSSGHPTSAQVNLSCAQVLRNAPTVSVPATTSSHPTSAQVNLSCAQVLRNAPTMIMSTSDRTHSDSAAHTMLGHDGKVRATQPCPETFTETFSSSPPAAIENPSNPASLDASVSSVDCHEEGQNPKKKRGRRAQRKKPGKRGTAASSADASFDASSTLTVEEVSMPVATASKACYPLTTRNLRGTDASSSDTNVLKAFDTTFSATGSQILRGNQHCRRESISSVTGNNTLSESGEKSRDVSLSSAIQVSSTATSTVLASGSRQTARIVEKLVAQPLKIGNSGDAGSVPYVASSSWVPAAQKQSPSVSTSQQGFSLGGLSMVSSPSTPPQHRISTKMNTSAVTVHQSAIVSSPLHDMTSPWLGTSARIVPGHVIDVTDPLTLSSTNETSAAQVTDRPFRVAKNSGTDPSLMFLSHPHTGCSVTSVSETASPGGMFKSSEGHMPGSKKRGSKVIKQLPRKAQQTSSEAVRSSSVFVRPEVGLGSVLPCTTNSESSVPVLSTSLAPKVAPSSVHTPAPGHGVWGMSGVPRKGIALLQSTTLHSPALVRTSVPTHPPPVRSLTGSSQPVCSSATTPPRVPSDVRPCPPVPSDVRPCPRVPSDVRPCPRVPSDVRPCPTVPSDPVLPVPLVTCPLQTTHLPQQNRSAFQKVLTSQHSGITDSSKTHRHQKRLPAQTPPSGFLTKTTGVHTAEVVEHARKTSVLVSSCSEQIPGSSLSQQSPVVFTQSLSSRLPVAATPVEMVSQKNPQQTQPHTLKVTPSPVPRLAKPTSRAMPLATPTSSKATPIQSETPPTASQSFPAQTQTIYAKPHTTPPPHVTSTPLQALPVSQTTPLTSQTVQVSQTTPLTTQAMHFKSQAASFMSQATPLKYRTMPLTSQTMPSTSQATPLASQAMPLTSQVTPLTSQATPLASQVTPLTSQATPLTSQAMPLASQATFLASQATFLTSQATPLTSQATPLASQATATSPVTGPGGFPVSVMPVREGKRQMMCITSPMNLQQLQVLLSHLKLPPGCVVKQISSPGKGRGSLAGVGLAEITVPAPSLPASSSLHAGKTSDCDPVTSVVWPPALDKAQGSGSSRESVRKTGTRKERAGSGVGRKMGDGDNLSASMEDSANACAAPSPLHSHTPMENAANASAVPSPLHSHTPMENSANASAAPSPLHSHTPMENSANASAVPSPLHSHTPMENAANACAAPSPLQRHTHMENAANACAAPSLLHRHTPMKNAAPSPLYRHTPPVSLQSSTLPCTLTSSVAPGLDNTPPAGSGSVGNSRKVRKARVKGPRCTKPVGSLVCAQRSSAESQSQAVSTDTFKATVSRRQVAEPAVVDRIPTSQSSSGICIYSDDQDYATYSRSLQPAVLKEAHAGKAARASRKISSEPVPFCPVSSPLAVSHVMTRAEHVPVPECSTHNPASSVLPRSAGVLGVRADSWSGVQDCARVRSVSSESDKVPQGASTVRVNQTLAGDTGKPPVPGEPAPSGHAKSSSGQAIRDDASQVSKFPSGPFGKLSRSPESKHQRSGKSRSSTAVEFDRSAAPAKKGRDTGHREGGERLSSVDDGENCPMSGMWDGTTADRTPHTVRVDSTSSPTTLLAMDRHHPTMYPYLSSGAVTSNNRPHTVTSTLSSNVRSDSVTSVSHHTTSEDRSRSDVAPFVLESSSRTRNNDPPLLPASVTCPERSLVPGDAPTAKGCDSGQAAFEKEQPLPRISASHILRSDDAQTGRSVAPTATTRSSVHLSDNVISAVKTGGSHHWLSETVSTRSSTPYHYVSTISAEANNQPVPNTSSRSSMPHLTPDSAYETRNMASSHHGMGDNSARSNMSHLICDPAAATTAAVPHFAGASASNVTLVFNPHHADSLPVYTTATVDRFHTATLDRFHTASPAILLPPMELDDVSRDMELMSGPGLFPFLSSSSRSRNSSGASSIEPSITIDPALLPFDLMQIMTQQGLALTVTEVVPPPGGAEDSG